MKLSPHPVEERSYLQFANPQRELFQLIIFDLHGRVVKRYAPQRGDVFEIVKDDFEMGIYLYQLVGKSPFFGKMVVK